MKVRLYNCILLVGIACASPSVQAIMLSEIELSSYLNQGLDARIELGGIKTGDLESMNLRILETEGAGDFIPEMLKVEVKDDGNRHYIHITSRENIREPILSFILELTWAEGHLIREYFILMDPKN